MRVEVHDHEDDVAAGAALGVGDDLVAVGGVEGQVSQLLERGVPPADVVEQRDVRRQGAPLRLGGGPVARPKLELLGVEILLAAGS